MNRGAGAVVDNTELIKWYDALDTLTGNTRPRNVVKGLQMAHECQHPDVVWLAALFSAGTEVTRHRMHEVMLEHGDDQRAMWLAWEMRSENPHGPSLSEATERGYTPAQVLWAAIVADNAERLQLLELSSAQNDRNTLYDLGRWWQQWENGREKVIDSFRRAAELNHRRAQMQYGRVAFGPTEWERYHWWSQAAEGGANTRSLCCEIV
jgi:hypothetical protein